jgi:hypothetical protein
LLFAAVKHHPLPQPSNAIFAPATLCHLVSSITVAAFPVIRRCYQPPLPTIATRCRSRQTPSLLPPPFAVFHCHIHQMHSNITAPFEPLCSPQTVAPAVGV